MRRLKLAALAFPALLVADVAVSPFMGVSAVDATGQFEMDGNIAHDSTTTPPYDWANLFDASGNKLSVTGLQASVFVKDAATPDQSYLAPTKDILPITAWSCSPLNNPTPKDDIQNAYAAVFKIPATAPENAGHTVITMGVERLSNNGDSFAGFWLFKDRNVGCSGTNLFSGTHSNGDILVLTNFTNGGGTASVDVYEWTGGPLGSPVPLTTGNVCGVSPGGTGGESVCAISNAASTITSPWAPTSHDSQTFTEAAVDLTQLFGSPNSSGPCFSNFLAETRSSQEITATLKDFAGGLINTCVAPTVNTTATPGGGSNLPGTTQHDVANLAVPTGDPAPTGTVTFFLCTPSQVTSAGCPSGAGTQIGSPVTVSGAAATSANVNGTTTPNTNTIGKYCWGAQYTPDQASANNYLAAYGTDASAECFTVIKASPTLPTNINVNGNGDLGATSLGDTATLTGTAGSQVAGETITFDLFGPYAAGVTPTCVSGANEPVFTTTGTLGPTPAMWTATTSQSFTPTATGTYVWTAHYAGDALNNPASEPCNVGAEKTTISTPSLTVTKTADHATVSAGDQIGFVITVSNAASAGTARGVTLTDSLPGGAGVSWSVATQPAQGSCAIGGSPPAQTLSCTFGDIAAGASLNVHVVSATTASSCKAYLNTATANASNLTTNNGNVSSNQASTTVQCPNVSVLKTPDHATVNAGSPIGFGITVSNSGATGTGTAYGVSLSDPLPAGTNVFWSIASQTLNACSISGAQGGQTLTCNIGTMAPGATYSVHIISQTTQLDCTTYPNTASVSVSNENGDPFTSQATITVQCPGLTISKTADASPVTVGDPVGFKVTVGNAGPGTATSVTVNDNLPSGTGTNWSIDTQPTQGSCAISGAVGSQVLTCSLGDLVANQSVFVHITSATSFDSHAAYPFNLPNTATASATNAPSKSSSATIVVEAPVLSVTKTPDASPVTVGDAVGFKITVANSNAEGTGIARSVTLHDPLPGGSGVDWSINTQPAQGSCSISGAVGSQVLDCTLGDMAPGASLFVHITSGTSFDSHASYPLHLPNTATATPTNGNPASGSGSIQINAPLLSVTKTPDATPVSTGDTVGFTITVSNSDAANTGTAKSVTLNDPLPGGSGVDWSVDTQPAAGSCTVTGAVGSQVMSCSLGDMAPGATLTIHITSDTSFDSNATYPLTLPNTATATPTNGNPASGSGSIVVQAPDLSVTKTPDATPVTVGDTIGFTITVANSDVEGTGTAKGVTLNDPLPGGTGVDWSVDTQPAQGSCSISGAAGSQTLTCSLGDMAPGASLQVHITSGTSFDSEATYPLTLPNTATATPTNGNPASGSGSIVVQAPVISVVKTADASPVNTGDKVGFTITVSNSDAEGTGTATSVVLTDPLPSGSGVIWSVDTGPSQGSCDPLGTTAPQTLTCHLGDIAPGGSVTLHITATTTFDSSAHYPLLLDNTATATPSNGNPASGHDSITVDAPVLTVVKTPDAAAVSAGDKVGFTITVSNSDAPGTGLAKSVTLNDPLPAGSGADWSIDSQPSQGSCSIAGPVGSQTLTCALGDMKPGDSLSVHITGTTKQVNSETYPQTLANTATATPTNGNPASGSGNINIVASGVLAVPATGLPFPLRGLVMLLMGMALIAAGMGRKLRRRRA